MSKKSRSEGNKVASLIKANKAEYYIADVDLGDNTDDVKAAVQSAVKTLGKKKAAFIVISAGTKCLSVVVSVPDEFQIDFNEWLQSSVKDIDGDKQFIENSAVITTNTPFKLIDMVRSSGFSYLRKNGFLDEEESSEEFVGFDDI